MENNIDECILQIKELNDLNIYFNNITNIKVIGDIHGDLDILLNYLHHLRFINVFRDNATEEIKRNSIIYEDYAKNISFNYHNNKNLLLYENIYDTVNFTNNYYIVFNNDIINSIQTNTAFIFLGDICDTHYTYNTIINPDINIQNTIFNNDIGCYQLLFILKTIIEENNTNHLILLFGNHEFNSINDNPIKDEYKNDLYKYIDYNRINLFKNDPREEIKKWINSINDWYNNKLTDIHKNDFFSIYSYMFYMITPKDYVNISNNYNYSKQNRDYNMKLYIKIYDIFKRRYNIRKSFLLSNKNNFNYIVSFNNRIIISHNFLYQNIINKLINYYLNSNNSNIQNNHIISQILESIFKYLLIKIYNNDYECLKTNNNIQKYFTYLINEKIKNNKFIICDINKENINNIQNNTCQNKVHIIGHIPQTYNKDENINNINQIPLNNNNIPIIIPQYINEQQYIQNYQDFYIYMIDFHLSKSFEIFYNNNDNNNKYYLEININGDNISRQFIKFMNKQRRQREDETQDEQQDRTVRQRLQGGYKLFL